MYKIYNAISLIPEEEIELSALEQIARVSKHPYLDAPFIILPDVHAGEGATIGSVIPLINFISPSMIGYDIGCGIWCERLDFGHAPFDNISLARLEDFIRTNIPLGFNHRTTVDGIGDFVYKTGQRFISETFEINEKYNLNALLSLGTLGGGNHFIELTRGDDGFVYLLIHSGSRNIGHRIASEYMEKAKTTAEYTNGLIPTGLGGFSEGDDDYDNYYEEYLYATSFAHQNRNIMAKLIINYMAQEGLISGSLGWIDTPHNFLHVDIINSQIIHYKGAINAFDSAIVAGSMGTNSYIVQSTPEAQKIHWACSHGAGRRFSRKQAKEILSVDDFKRMVRDVYGCQTDQNHIDESPMAYKDIEYVMESQGKTIVIKTKLTPFFNIKG